MAGSSNPLMSTTRTSGYCLAIRPVASIPSMRGMRTSIRTTSGWLFLSLSRASLPSRAVPTTWTEGMRARKEGREFTTNSSSSTTSVVKRRSADGGGGGGFEDWGVIDGVGETGGVLDFLKNIALIMFD